MAINPRLRLLALVLPLTLSTWGIMCHGDFEFVAEYHHGIDLPESMRDLDNRCGPGGGRLGPEDSFSSRFIMARQELQPWLQQFVIPHMDPVAGRYAEQLWYFDSLESSAQTVSHSQSKYIEIDYDRTPNHDMPFACSVGIGVDSLNPEEIVVELGSSWD